MNKPFMLGEDDSTVANLEELQCVVVRLQVLVSHKFWIVIRVQRADDCSVHSLMSSVLIESFRYKASFYVPEVVEQHLRSLLRGLVA